MRRRTRARLARAEAELGQMAAAAAESWAALLLAALFAALAFALESRL